MGEYKALKFCFSFAKKHTFYTVSDKELKEAEEKLGFEIPYELKVFYQKVGCDFFNNEEKYEIDRLVDPLDLALIYLKEEYYEYDPNINMYHDLYKGQKMIFFEVNEGVYLAIDKSAVDRKNAIYYWDQKIFDSLEQFLVELDNNPKLIEQIQASI